MHVLLVHLVVALREALEVHEDGPSDEHEDSVQVDGGEVVGALACSGQRGDHLVSEDGRDVRLEEPEIGQIGIAGMAVASEYKDAELAVKAT